MADDRRYRVLPGPDDAHRFLDREGYEPVLVAAADQPEPVADLRSGYLVDAALEWSSPEPTVRSLSVRRPTLYAFADDVDPMFEVATETWREAQAASDAMNTRVLRDTDGAATGALYVFAEGGEPGRFEELRDGTRPIEPLVDRVNDREGAAAREVFVLRGVDGAFTAVVIALRKGGQLADVLRETYDRPRPEEPLG